MDYLQIYNEQFNSTWKEEKDQTIKAFKLAKENNKNFNTVFNKINASQYQKQKKMVADFNERNQLSCYDLFEKRYQEYDNDLPRDEIISLALKNEVKNEFVVLGNTEYDLFIRKLAKQQSIFEIQNHFSNYTSYYELIYKQGKYEYFHAKNFENYDLKDSEEFIEMLNIKYPSRPKTAIKIQEETNHSNNQSKVSLTTKERIRNEFDTKERAVLIHLIKTRLNTKTIDTTELIKLILIIGATDEFNIFEVSNASNSYLYKQANQGYSVFKKVKQKDKIANLKAKLRNNGLKSIAEELQINYNT
jgi:hypothetical protein